MTFPAWFTRPLALSLRALVAVCGVSVVFWLYASSPSFADRDTGLDVACTPVREEPGSVHPGTLLGHQNAETRKALHDYVDSSADPGVTVRYNDLADSWSDKCQATRAGRQSQILLAAAGFALVFLVIRVPKKIHPSDHANNHADEPPSHSSPSYFARISWFPFRPVFAALATCFIAALYVTSPGFYDLDTSQALNRTGNEYQVRCEPIVSLSLNRPPKHRIVIRDAEAEDIFQQYIHHHGDDERIVNRLSDNLDLAWNRGCEVARDSRHTRIRLDIIAATVIFFTIPPRKKAAPDKQTDGPVSQKTTPTPVNNTNHTAPNPQPNETETEETT